MDPIPQIDDAAAVKVQLIALISEAWWQGGKEIEGRGDGNDVGALEERVHSFCSEVARLEYQK